MLNANKLQIVPINAPQATSCKKCCERYTLEKPISAAVSKQSIFSLLVLHENATHDKMVKTVVECPDGNVL